MRAQEAQEEEERKAQEAQEKEERKAQEAHDEEKAQEEQEKEVSAQGERESQVREGKAQGERREEREVEAQERHEGEEEMTTQEKCVEAKKEANSMHEENDVSNRHMTWWRNAWWIRVDNGPHMRTARGRRRTWRAARRAAEQARDDDRVKETQSRRGRGRREMVKKEMGARENWKRSKQHPTRCLPPPNRKRKKPTNNNNNSSISSNRSNALAANDHR